MICCCQTFPTCSVSLKTSFCIFAVSVQLFSFFQAMYVKLELKMDLKIFQQLLKCVLEFLPDQAYVLKVSNH